MKINDILEETEIISSYIPKELYGASISSLCLNSECAKNRCVFFCKVGALTDGHKYAHQAYANGARIFIAEKSLELPSDAAIIITPDTNTAIERLSVLFYGYPADKLKMIGITGTKGKTTVAVSIYKIAVSYGIKMGYIGTNGIYFNGRTYETHNTTPDAISLQRTLREMLDSGVTTVVVEVSSQAIWQRRIYGIKFDTCIFTNLYRDHIGGYEHPSFEHYRDSKKALFSEYCINNIIINQDSNESGYMISDATNQNIITTSAIGNKECSLYADSVIKIQYGMRPGISFNCLINPQSIYKTDESAEVFIPFPGRYSAENGLLVIAACMLLNIKFDFIVNELASLSISGRFEAVRLNSKPNSLAIIDYAHNGASLRAVLKSLCEYEHERIICVFGSVGERTLERRKELGTVANELSDVIILTSDNPNHEDPSNIMNDIRSAMGKTDKPVFLIEDRYLAIKKAVELAEDGDFILIAGKGHESYQLINGEKVPFSDKRSLEEIDMQTSNV